MSITMGQNRDNSGNILKINEDIEIKYSSIKIIQSVILYTELLGSFQETFVLNQTVILSYRFVSISSRQVVAFMQVLHQQRKSFFHEFRLQWINLSRG